MAQPKAQQEPTMEEILASIRRIIDSGEEAERDMSARHDADVGGYSEATNTYSAQPDERARIHNFASDNAVPAPEQSNVAWQKPEPVVVSKRHNVEVEEPQAQAVQQERVPEAQEDQTVQSPQPQQDVYPGSIGEVAEQVRAATQASSQPSETKADDLESLVSSEAEKRIGEALQELSFALQREGARSIEEIVAEELRPLLSTWLEDHMPTIVENMVAKEIERMRQPVHK